MKILIVTDAWRPQVNGVVTTLIKVGEELENKGYIVEYLTPNSYSLKVPLPTYPEIKVALDVWRTKEKIVLSKPDFIHIATEGPIGVSARIACEKMGVSFTTSYHTKMPEYVNERAPWISTEVVYKFLRWLHKPSKAILVTTPSMETELKEHKFTAPIQVWSRGVDTNIFNPSYRNRDPDDDCRWLLYVGRVSCEKNLEAFLGHKIPNTKTIVVGDGPDKKKLQQQYPHVEFVGYKMGPALATYYANADVFVFPSKTDTFGIVMIEANACGTPVAAYPVTGPKDFVVNGINGILDEHIDVAIINALNVQRQNCVEHVEENYTWKQCADILERAMWKDVKIFAVK